MSQQRLASEETRFTCRSIGALWAGAASLVALLALNAPRAARAVPAFAQQTGQPCKSCHVGGFGPELTKFGREFKLGGYSLRAHASIPLAAMLIGSWTHTGKDQDPPPDHLGSNDNLVLDQASLFIAGGLGNHFGAFAQVTYDGVGRTWAWDNLDLRAVTSAKLFGADSVVGLTINNSPTVEDPWNTLPAWGFPYTDTAVSPTPGAGLLIDGPLAQGVMGASLYAWIGHKFYVEGGGYLSPSRGLLQFLGVDPTAPGAINGIAPYARIAYQADVAGGTFEVGANALRASIFPARERSSGFSDHYTDWGVDGSYLKRLGASGFLSAAVRFAHEHGDLSASCALAFIGDGTDPGCARYHLDEWRVAVRYTRGERLGFTLSPFSISGSRNLDLYPESGLPNSKGVTGQVDYTFWPDGNSPLGPLVNARIGIQYTAYGKFNGRGNDFDARAGKARDNDALRAFAWLAF